MDQVEIIRNSPCVYFISDNNGHCKIGVASDIHNRFNTLQVGSAFELTIKDIFYTETLKEAYELENEYHIKLAKKNIRGEWFDEIAVDNVLAGKTIDGEKKKSLIDFCEPGQYNFCNIINFFLLGLECCRDKQMFIERFERETPEYLKNGLYEFYRYQNEQKRPE